MIAIHYEMALLVELLPPTRRIGREPEVATVGAYFL